MGKRVLSSLSRLAFVAFAWLVVHLSFPAIAAAQVLILPGPRPRPTVKLVFERFALTGTIRDQIGRISIECVLSNDGQAPGEADFLVPIPPGAVLHNVTLIADGKEIPGELLSRDEALREYTEIVRRYRDPALVEFLDTSLFRSRIFPIPPGKNRTLQLSVTFACTSSDGTVSAILPLPHRTSRSLIPKTVSLDLHIKDRRPIRSVYVREPWVDTTTVDSHHARVRGESRDTAPGAVTIYYRLSEQDFTAWVLSYWPQEEDKGYYVLFLVPPFPEEVGAEYQPKDVILVIDTSGSMAGRKLEQVKDASVYILRNLRSEDRFALVTYSDDVEVLTGGVKPVRENRIEAAVRDLRALRAHGGTNIEAALKTALGLVDEDERPTYVLFLTDGKPTVGERDVGKLVRSTERSLPANARLICFGVGHDVNSRLVTRLAQVGNGRAILVPPDSDLEREIAALYQTISVPALTDVHVRLKGVRVSLQYPERVHDLFAGEETVLVGRYQGESSDVTLHIRGKIRGKQIERTVSLSFARRGRGIEHAFVARLWASRRIGHLLEEIDLEGPQESLLDEIVRLSQKYGIPTPYTSFLAKEPDSPARRAALMRDAIRRQARELRAMDSGAGLFAARVGVLALREAPARPRVGFPLDGGRMQDRDTVYLGGKTFVRTSWGWVESTLSDEEIRTAEVIEIGSEAFFDLIRRIPPHQRAFLRLDPPIWASIGGNVYRFETTK